MIIEKKGDLFLGDEKIIAHGCNCQGSFGAGFALHILNKYPKASESFIEQHRKEPWKLGEIQVVDCGERIIVNLLTQKYYGNASRTGIRYCSYDALDVVFKKLLEVAKVKKEVVAIPLIGAGLAGGKWDIILEIIKSHFEHSKEIIVIYYLD